MKVADLYVRVSTDEQADKGYSQRNQDETLQRYCQLQDITVRRIIYEDYSAKTFNRPAWKTMLSDYKKKTSVRANYVLFTKWDRFSRNAADAYQMINLLRSYGIEPQAIEQPLDLTIPENKIMLAFYLAAPEVENDRRALNVFHGMRRAKKEGRWMATAPIGYINKSHEDGRKYIAVNEPIAAIMRRAFEQISTGKYSIDQVWKEARLNGLTCNRNNFWSMIRNPVYCGKIIVPSYRDEPSEIVEAQHQSIITESLFEKAQEVLDGRKRQKTQVVVPSRISLRGFLRCPKCNRMLTGSASKGCRSYYYYYHCSSACGIRFNADHVNKALLNELSKYKVRSEFEPLFKKILREVTASNIDFQSNTRHQTEKKIANQQLKFSRAKELLLAGDLDADDYRSIKQEIDSEITALRKILIDNEDSAKAIDEKIIKLDRGLFDLAKIFQKANITQKRELIDLLYHDKFSYDLNGLHKILLRKELQLVFTS
ncbi:DNA invertase Pin-like site-specific DNA recombinase/transcription elongation factor Elf1 [Mucilaginibacter sp. SG538B]|uniref:recombinase family protein n=1 Tax=Mucilaginibacter sp. SG538B TaxID=2587021 RepID=UPI00159CF40D|nr:recombinase family protein [Mucilaginibacter sp. SG538B]NVM65079.1 DNA invertase Pin-like site-specific DNA recombinase/transcription elongation factor Elf1 [Mucilaginibacter sp. SG538B]